MLFNFFWNLIILVFTLSILITIHECGHFFVAKFFNVKIERFSIGFGPTLWKWRDKNNIEYVISAIFFGGYVKFFNEDDMGDKISILSKYNIFDKISIWKRSIIIISGSVFNFLFAVFFYTLVYIFGISTYQPIVDSIESDSFIAKFSNIYPGMKISSINGVKTPDWESVRLQIFQNIGKEKIIISTISPKTLITEHHTIELPKNWFYKSYKLDPIEALGIKPIFLRIEPVISEIVLGSPAMKAGLKIGDKIMSIDGTSVYIWETFVKKIKDNPNKILKIVIKRDKKILSVDLIPEKKWALSFKKMEGVVGIKPSIISIPKKYEIYCKYNLYEAFVHACKQVWQLICLTVNMLNKLIIGQIRLNSLGGPISIAQGAGESARHGFVYYLVFLTLISINLGVINLFPFPFLDGGHILFLIIEKFWRKSILNTIKDFSYWFAALMLIIIICLIIFNDINRLL